MNSERLQRLTEQIVAHGLDGLALMPGPNMLYISGIDAHLSERPILLFIPADDDPAIIIPTLEAMKARAAGIPEERIFAWDDAEGYHGAFQQACAHLELADYMLGVEALHMRVLELQLLQRYAPGLQVAHAEAVLSALRSVKDADEVAAMEKAIAIAEKALKRIIPRIKVGLNERQITAMLTQELLASGAESIAFGPIVAGGPNSAIPHAVPGDRAIRPGDLLVIDWGIYADGYPSDITRTLAVGEIDDELRHIFDVVNEANAAARKTVRPGVTGQAVDRAARDVIEAAGKRPVVFRTVYIGGDKALPYLRHDDEDEENPAMGWRAIRIALERDGLMKAQARALIEAAAGKTLNVMFPMVSEPWEFDQARAIFEAQREFLIGRGKRVPSLIRYGAMLEVPALAECLDILLPKLEFISIGTNDLTQFLFAADRAHPKLAERFDWLSPAILRFLARVVKQCDAAKVPVTVCGEMGGRGLEALALLGLGIERLSITPAAVGPIKAMIRSLDIGAARSIVSGLLESPPASIRATLGDWAASNKVEL